MIIRNTFSLFVMLNVILFRAAGATALLAMIVESNRNGGYCEGRTTGRGVFRTHYCWCEYDEDEVTYNFGGPVGQMIGGLLLFTPFGRILRIAAPALAG